MRMGLKRISAGLIVGVSICIFINGVINFHFDRSSKPGPQAEESTPQVKEPTPTKVVQNLNITRAPSALPPPNKISSTQPIRQNFFSPNPKLSIAPRSNRLKEFLAFENLFRKQIPTNFPELNGWSILPEVTWNDDPLGPGEKSLSFKSLHFKTGGANNPSTLQQFRGPIAVIFPETKKIAVITGRISVLHKGVVDRNQFAEDHNLKLDSAPENSKSATYLTEPDHSLLDARTLLARDPRVDQVEIELLTEGVKK